MYYRKIQKLKFFVEPNANVSLSRKLAVQVEVNSFLGLDRVQQMDFEGSLCVVSCETVDMNVQRWLDFIRPHFDHVHVRCVESEAEDLSDGFGMLSFSKGPKPWDDFSHQSDVLEKVDLTKVTRLVCIDASYLQITDECPNLFDVRDYHVWSLTANESPDWHLQRGFLVLEDSMSMQVYQNYLKQLSGPPVKKPMEYANRFEVPLTLQFKRRFFRMGSLYSFADLSLEQKEGPLSGPIKTPNISQAHWDALLLRGCPVLVRNRKKFAKEESFLKTFHFV